MPVILVGGGSRSGKSRQALTLARARGGSMAFVATAEVRDAEMRERITRHQQERGEEFTTIEEPIDLAGALARCAEHQTVVIDCLTLWVSNLMLAEENIGERLEQFLSACALTTRSAIAVTNEVGCGIVPENELARRFRDEAGRVNQQVAEAAREVYWMIFGCPLRIK